MRGLSEEVALGGHSARATPPLPRVSCISTVSCVTDFRIAVPPSVTEYKAVCTAGLRDETFVKPVRLGWIRIARRIGRVVCVRARVLSSFDATYTIVPLQDAILPGLH